MTVDASARARVLGVSAEYRNLRTGSILNLPQRVGLFAQGATDSSFLTTKFTALSAGEVGAKLGFGSPAHLAARELLPENGDGLGTVPLDVFPLADHGSGVMAAGLVTPSGTQTKTASYVARISNIYSQAFTVAAADSVSARCRALHDAINAVLHMPVSAEYNYGSVTAQAGTNGGNGTCTVLSATGQPTPGAWTLELNTEVANGGVWTLTDPDGNEIADDVTMTPGAGAATVISEGGLQFTLTDGANDFELGDTFTITVPATSVDLNAKWKGTTANDIVVAIEGDDYGTTWTIVQPTGGLNDPTVDAAIAQVGPVWVTMALNGNRYDNTTALDAFQTFGDGRWGDLVHKPMVVFVGNTKITVADATAISSGRKTDKVNAQLVAPGCEHLPIVVAARQLARIARQANNNPPTNYGALRATGLKPGADGDQWDHTKRDAALKLGCSTVEIANGEINIADVVTFYRPDGEEPPAFRYVVDIVKLQNIIYNIVLEFAQQEWAGAPLIPDNQPTNNPNARKPKDAKARLATITDNLGLAAIISDPAGAKKSITAAIDSGNPKRLNLDVTYPLSGNTDIIDVPFKFGFFFGQLQAA